MRHSSSSSNSLIPRPRWCVALAAGVALSTLVALPATAATAPPQQQRTTASVPLDRAALRASITGLNPAEFTGVLVRAGGERGDLWKGTSGATVPTPDAHFRIGSISKMFTATVVLQLVGEGRLSLDDTVQERLPGLLDAGYVHPVTVRNLLDHTSGLPKPPAKIVEGTGVEVVRSATRGLTPTEPGKTQQYHGINYFILGVLVEKVTGHSFASETERRIIRPLGLRHTSVPDIEDTSMPSPYTRGMVAAGPDSPLDVETTRQRPWPWAEGGMISTAGDLEHFQRALFQGRLLKPAQQRQAFEVPDHIEGASYAAGGFQRFRMQGLPEIWGKTGSRPGYTSGVFATRDLKRRLVYSFNSTGRASAETGLKTLLRVADAAF
ncbi:serine hydrolase domain-containing protein [Streptomyces sp. NPDC054863]